MEMDGLTRLRIFSKGIGVRPSTIYRQLQSEKREKRRNICMSLMTSDLLLHSWRNVCVHTPEPEVPEERIMPKKELLLRPECPELLESHALVSMRHWACSVAGLYECEV